MKHNFLILLTITGLAQNMQILSSNETNQSDLQRDLQPSNQTKIAYKNGLTALITYQNEEHTQWVMTYYNQFGSLAARNSSNPNAHNDTDPITWHFMLKNARKINFAD